MKFTSKSITAYALAVFSLLLLGTAVTSIPHAGQSAFILAQNFGIDPLPLFANPVYGWIVKLLAMIGGSSAILLVNFFSAVCGAITVMLIFLFVYRASRSFNIDSSVSSSDMHRIQLASGIISAFYLLASPPFWLASTRANPLMFDLALLLTAFYLLISYNSKAGLSRLLLASLIYGIAVVEFTTAIILTPMFGILLLVKLWDVKGFHVKHLALAISVSLMGLLLYFVQAALYMATPAYEWREFTGFFQLLGYIWLEQYQSLTGGLPRVGWLTLALVSFLPLMITTGFRLPGGSARAQGAMLGTVAMNAMLLVLSVLLLLPDFPLSPVNLTGMIRLFVTPYVLIALWVGNVVAFCLVMLFREKRFEGAVWHKIRRVAGTILVTGFPVFLLVTAALEARPAARDPVEKIIWQFSSAVVDTAADKEWLITNTMLDDQIAIEAHRRGLPLKLLRLSYGRTPVYMKYVASLFAHDPRLESLAQIGISPLMDEWFGQYPDVENKAAVINLPDMWMMAGFEAVPDMTLFAGAKAGEDIPIDELLAKHRKFWSEYGEALSQITVEKNSPAGYAVDWIRVHLSKVANNFGVFLEDHGRSDDAFSVYQQARKLAPDNLSALMNMHVLAQREKRPEYEALEQELTQATENVMGKVQTWSLSYLYGFVRVPELFANRGMAFAMSGKASMAINDMKRALSLSEKNPQVQLALAGLYFSQEKDTESKEYYDEVLKANPENPAALLGLMRVLIRQNKIEEARRILAQLKDLNVSPTALAMEEAVLESMAGSPALALQLFQKVVKEQPDNMQAWAAIVIAALQMNDRKLGEEAMAKLQQAKVLSPSIQLVMAQAALNQGDREASKRYLSEILRRQPGNIQALEMLLRLDMYEGSRDQIQLTVEKILTFDPRNALANYMLGVHHYYKQEYALAESAYRASLESSRTPQALNDLAYVLYKQQKFDDAETLVRESLAINDRNSSAWDTLGAVLMEKNQLAESEAALLKSLTIKPNTASVLLTLALLHEKQDRLDESLKNANEINARMNELSPEAQTKLRGLIDRLEDSRR